jgi:hypothetical protein
MPLAKTCSTKAMSKNMRKCIREGESRSRCAAMSYRTLKRACRVKSKKRMTPKQIVAKRRRRR